MAGWIVSESLVYWAGRWGALEAEAVGHRLCDAILSTSEAEGLTLQCYWLSTAIAMGGLLRVRDCLDLAKPQAFQALFVSICHKQSFTLNHQASRLYSCFLA